MNLPIFQTLAAQAGALAAGSGPVVSDAPTPRQATRHPAPPPLQQYPNANPTFPSRSSFRSTNQLLQLPQQNGQAQRYPTDIRAEGFGPSAPPDGHQGGMFIGNEEFHPTPMGAVPTPSSHPPPLFCVPTSRMPRQQQPGCSFWPQLRGNPPPPADYGQFINALQTSFDPRNAVMPFGPLQLENTSQLQLPTPAESENSNSLGGLPPALLSQLSDAVSELKRLMSQQDDGRQRPDTEKKPPESNGTRDGAGEGSGWDLASSVPTDEELSTEHKEALKKAYDYYDSKKRLVGDMLANKIPLQDGLKHLSAKDEQSGGAAGGSLDVASLSNGALPSQRKPEGPESILPGHCKDCAEKPRWEQRNCSHASHMSSEQRFAALKARFRKSVATREASSPGSAETEGRQQNADDGLAKSEATPSGARRTDDTPILQRDGGRATSQPQILTSAPTVVTQTAGNSESASDVNVKVETGFIPPALGGTSAEIDMIVGLRFRDDQPGVARSVSTGADVVIPDAEEGKSNDCADISSLPSEPEVSIVDAALDVYDVTFTDFPGDEPFVAIGYNGWEPFCDEDVPMADMSSRSDNSSSGNNQDLEFGLIIDGEELTTNVWPYYYCAFFRELGLSEEARLIEDAGTTPAALRVVGDVIRRLTDEKDPTYGENVQRNADRWPQLRGRAVMWTALRAKFYNDPRARDWLINTGTRFLAYAAEGDKYWGTGMSVKQIKGFMMANVLTGDDLASVCLRQQRADVGENVMGFMLCQLRSQISKAMMLSRWRPIFDANVTLMTASSNEATGDPVLVSENEQTRAKTEQSSSDARQPAVDLSADFAGERSQEDEQITEEKALPEAAPEPMTVVPGSRIFRSVDVDETDESHEPDQAEPRISYLESAEPRRRSKGIRRRPILPVYGGWSSGSDDDEDMSRRRYRRHRHRQHTNGPQVRQGHNFNNTDSAPMLPLTLSTDIHSAPLANEHLMLQLQTVSDSINGAGTEQPSSGMLGEPEEAGQVLNEAAPVNTINSIDLQHGVAAIDMSIVKAEPGEQPVAPLPSDQADDGVGPGLLEANNATVDLNLVKSEHPDDDDVVNALQDSSNLTQGLQPIDPVARLKGLLDIGPSVDAMTATAAFAASATANGFGPETTMNGATAEVHRPGMASSNDTEGEEAEEEDADIRKAMKRQQKRIKKQKKKERKRRRRQRKASPSSSDDSDASSSANEQQHNSRKESDKRSPKRRRIATTEDGGPTVEPVAATSSRKREKKAKKGRRKDSSSEDDDDDTDSSSSDNAAIGYRNSSPAAYRRKRKEVKIRPRPKVRGFAVLNPCADRCALAGARIAHEPIQVERVKHHSPIHYFYVKMFEHFDQTVLVDTVQEMAYNENVLGLVTDVLARQGSYSSLSGELVEKMVYWGKGKGRRLIKRAILDKIVMDYPLRRRLLQTGDKLIIDATIPDTVWGVGVAADEFAEYARDQNYSADQVRQINEEDLIDEGIGNNYMGLVLTEVRHILKHSYEAIECSEQDELITRGKDKMKITLLNLADIAVISKDSHFLLCSGGAGSVLVDGRTYKSLMRYYFEQLFKCFRLNPAQLQTFDRGSVSAQLRKYRGWLEYGSGLSRYDLPQVVQWELTEGLNYMRKAMKQKFCQSRELRSALFATRGRLLVEASLGPQESFWGIGMTSENFVRHVRERNYTSNDVHELCESGLDPVIGRNVIGLLLTDVRDEIWDWATQQAATAALNKVVKSEKMKLDHGDTKLMRVKREPA